MPALTVDLRICPEEYQKSYLGVRQVAATARDGRRVRFPAEILRPFVTHDGIYGTFIIYVDDHNKFLKIERIAD